jgi:hypothetical protein
MPKRLVALVVCLAMLSVVFDSIVIWCLWSWFVAKPFDLKHITIFESAGIGLLTTYLTYHYYPFQKEFDLHDLGFYVLIRPALTLFLAWIVHFLV